MILMKKQHINQTALLYKREGQTPLEVVEMFKHQRPEFSQTPIAYAGRLDPMAEGDLLLLLGEACKERTKYLGLDKAYAFEVLVGIGSDTHDILGLTQVNDTGAQAQDTEVDREHLSQILQALKGKQQFPYPAFSSKTVQGKPLFQWALEERLSEIEIPTKAVELYKLSYSGHYHLSRDKLLQTVRERIAQVTPVDDPRKKEGRDFRRVEVLDLWQKNLEAHCDARHQFTILQFECVCSSGTYMRVLARMIGEGLGSSGLAWRIKRNKMGSYRKVGPWGFWTQVYK